MSYNGPPPTSSDKDNVGKLFRTMGHHPPVVARIRPEKYVIQRATVRQSFPSLSLPLLVGDGPL
jgi:hypothetical protein